MNSKKTKQVKQNVCIEIFTNITTVHNYIFKMRQQSEKINEPGVTVYIELSQVTIIYIALFTLQIVSKQLYSIKQENSVSKEPKLHGSFLARQTSSLIAGCSKVQRTHLVPVVLSRWPSR